MADLPPVFTDINPEFEEEASKAVNSDSEYSTILSKTAELEEKKKQLIRKNKEILRLLRDMDEELEELENERFSRVVAIRSKLSESFRKQEKML